MRIRPHFAEGLTGPISRYFIPSLARLLADRLILTIP